MGIKFLCTGDFGGNVEAAQRLLAVDLKKYNFVVFTGDLIAMKALRKIGEATARGQYVNTKIDYADIRERLIGINKIFSVMTSKTLLYGILGNSDLRKTFISLVPKIDINNIHNRLVKVNGYAVMGYEGRPLNIDEAERPDEIEKAGIFPGRTYSERAKECNGWEEEKAFRDLSTMMKKADPRKSILITHYPPYGILDKVEEKNIPWAISSYGARSAQGNIGSDAFREISSKYNILLHVFSHVHESKGIRTIGSTKYVNIGSLEEDMDVCEIRIDDDKVNVDFLKLPPLSALACS